MAYKTKRRTTRSSGVKRVKKSAVGRSGRSSGRAKSRSGYATAKRSTRSRSSAVRTIKIVVEQAPANAVSRPTPMGFVQAPNPRKATF